MTLTLVFIVKSLVKYVILKRFIRKQDKTVLL